jgi:alanine racemase
MSRNTIARISQAALRHNLERVRLMAPNSKVACVVKADAYGHSLSRVLKSFDGADILAVATTGEAATCRKLGWSGRLLLLEGPSNSAEFDEMIALQAETVIHHENQLHMLRERQREVKQVLWLKIDTGMHRLGFPESDARAVHAELKSLCGNQEIVLMSHFSCADDAGNPFTTHQIERFENATFGLQGSVSLANSAGVLSFPDSHREYVRPGIMLYGISPCQHKSAVEIGLIPVMTLECDLIAINEAVAGESIGYGAGYTCQSDMRVGVAAIGYGDGYPHHSRNGTPVLINGRRAPLVGRVSMDMICIDLSRHDDARVGDTVTLWGHGLPVEEVATWSDSTPYHLICGVTARVRSISV